jgi:hypothetical protein
MQIHVARNSAQLGVFSSEEIVAGLQSGRFVATDLAWRDGLAVWTPLGDWAEFRGVGVPPPSPSAPASSGAKEPSGLPMPSWERGTSFADYVATIKEVALDPVRTFANLRDGGYARPISFTYWSLLPAWLCGSILYGALFGFMALAAKGATGGNDAFLTWINEVGPFVAALIISAALAVLFVFVPLFNFIGAAFTHVLLLPWKPAGGFAQTYRANAYAYGAFMPFAFIPCVNYVVMPWQLVAAIIAHSQVHRIAWWKVAVSLVVIPCLCVCGLYALLFAALAKGFAG